MRLSAGARLGQYEIVVALGTGGMGEVYRARDTKLQRPAAIKVITADEEDPDRVKRLEREALSASALNHPNILTVYELGSHEGLNYIVTELIEGETLRARIRRGPIPLADALDLATQVGAALYAAHTAGIVHRDIKPENVMVRPDGYVKVLDFGIAKLVESSRAAAESATLTVQTVPGMLLGTVGYMAPEQIRGLAVDQRADVWSFAVLLHEMLTGRSLFTGPTTSDIIAAVLERTPPSLGASGIDAPPELERILRKALAKDRENRYQTMKELLVDLRQVRQQPERVVVPPASPRSVVPVVAGASFLVIAMIVGWAVWNSSVRGPETRFPPPATFPSPSTAATRSFEYWLTVEPPPGISPRGAVESGGNEVFIAGSRFRFNFSNPSTGFVYVLNESTAPSGAPLLTMLYPTPSRRDGSAELTAGEVASTGNYFFDKNAGVERVWIVWSARPQEDLELAKRWVSPEHQGQVKDSDEARRIVGLLASEATKNTTARTDQPGKRTIVSGPGDLLVHKAELRTR